MMEGTCTSMEKQENVIGYVLQWSPASPDTLAPSACGQIIEVSAFQRLLLQCGCGRTLCNVTCDFKQIKAH